MRHIDSQAPVLVVIALALSGCGAGGFAPESPQSNAFLDQLSANCGKHSIGDQPIDYLLDVNSSDVYFADESSKLWAGEIDKATFSNNINSFYPTGTNQPALDCIFSQLGGS